MLLKTKEGKKEKNQPSFPACVRLTVAAASVRTKAEWFYTLFSLAAQTHSQYINPYNREQEFGGYSIKTEASLFCT